MKTKLTSVTPTQAAETLGTCGSTANVEAKKGRETGHTPGPWTGKTIFIREQPVMLKRYHFTDDSPAHAEALANARLIAAAPELLEACKTLFDYCSTFGDFPAACRKAQDAISKAEGKQNE